MVLPPASTPASRRHPKPARQVAPFTRADDLPPQASLQEHELVSLLQAMVGNVWSGTENDGVLVKAVTLAFAAGKTHESVLEAARQHDHGKQIEGRFLHEIVHKAKAVGRTADIAAVGVQARDVPPATQSAQTYLRQALYSALRHVVTAVQTGTGDAAQFAADSDIDQAAQTLEEAFCSIVDDRLASLAMPESASASFSAPEAYVPGYDAAVEAGAQARTDILKRADMLNSEEIAHRLGVTRETVNQRRRNGELLALQHEGRGFRYPSWQIEPGVREHLAELLAELGEGTNPWSAYLFFTQANPLLKGKSPLEALKAGKSSAALRAASAMREELA